MTSLQPQNNLPPFPQFYFPAPLSRSLLAVNNPGTSKSHAGCYSLLHLENSVTVSVSSATPAAGSGFSFTLTPSITMSDFHTPHKGHPKPQLLTFLFSSLLQPSFPFIPLHLLRMGFQTSTMSDDCDLTSAILTFTWLVWPLQATDLSLTLSLGNTYPSSAIKYHLNAESQASPPKSRFLWLSDYLSSPRSQ